MRKRKRIQQLQAGRSKGQWKAGALMMCGSPSQHAQEGSAPSPPRPHTHDILFKASPGLADSKGGEASPLMDRWLGAVAKGQAPSFTAV